jgi:hemerythrin-like domain-containing protein
MTENTPVQVLEHEHRLVQRVVAVMALMADRLRAGRVVALEDLRDIVTFLRVFADQCHHGKEERCLFPLLEERGVPPTGCPMGALKHEHDKGRALVAEFAKSVDDYSPGNVHDPLVAALDGLVDLYPNHIWKEDYLLFPMSGKVLSALDCDNLMKQFEAVESEIGPDSHERFESVVSRLEEGTRYA